LKFELAYASAYALARDGDAQLHVYSSLCLLTDGLREPGFYILIVYKQWRLSLSTFRLWSHEHPIPRPTGVFG